MHEPGIFEGGFSQKERREAESEYQAFSFGRVGSRVQTVLLIRTSDGQVEGFPYAQFDGISSENEEDGFTVQFGRREVMIAGRNLGDLFRYVCLFRAAEICEASEHNVMLAEASAPTVWTIRTR